MTPIISECTCGCRVVLSEDYIHNSQDPKHKHLWELFIAHHPQIPKEWVDPELKGHILLNESSSTGV